MKEIIKGCSYGTGNYTMPLIDLGDFLHMYEIKDGKIADTATGTGSLINSYFSMDMHYEKRGLAYAEQSMFGSVANDSSYNLTGIDFDVNYWQANMQYYINESDFVTRYSSAENGFYYALSSELISELKHYKKLEINIYFDISKLKNVNVLCFDYYALNGIKVKSLTISSSNNHNFNLLVGSLKDTELNKITTHNITLNNMSGLEVQNEVV